MRRTQLLIFLLKRSCSLRINMLIGFEFWCFCNVMKQKWLHLGLPIKRTFSSTVDQKFKFKLPLNLRHWKLSVYILLYNARICKYNTNAKMLLHYTKILIKPKKASWKWGIFVQTFYILNTRHISLKSRLRKHLI